MLLSSCLAICKHHMHGLLTVYNQVKSVFTSKVIIMENNLYIFLLLLIIFTIPLHSTNSQVVFTMVKQNDKKNVVNFRFYFHAGRSCA